MRDLQTRARHPAVVFLGICATAACVGLLVLALLSGDNSHRTNGGRASFALAKANGFPHVRRAGSAEPPLPPLSPTEPLGPPGIAQQVTLSTAPTTVGFSFPVPDTATAGPGNLSAVWAVSQQASEVALLYGGTQITIYIEQAPYADPTTAFTALISQFAANSEQANLTDVHGYVALVAAPPTPVVYDPNMVEFDRNGIDVRVTSTTLGTTALLGIANSMAAAQVSGQLNMRVRGQAHRSIGLGSVRARVAHPRAAPRSTRDRRSHR